MASLRETQEIQKPPAMKRKRSELISEKFVTSLKQASTKMDDETLYTQFVTMFLSDRSILYIQWCRDLVNGVFFRPSERDRLHFWFNEILYSSLQFKIQWTLPEQIFLQNQGNMFEAALQEYGIVSWIRPSPTHDAAYSCSRILSRPVKSLDGFTLILLSELFMRQKKPLTDLVRPEYGKIQFTMTLDVPQQAAYDWSRIFDARVTLLKHLMFTAIIYPFIVVRAPDQGSSSSSSQQSMEEVSLAMTISILQSIQIYLASALTEFAVEALTDDQYANQCTKCGSHPTTWKRELYADLTKSHSRQAVHVNPVISQLKCAGCKYCGLLESLVHRYYVVQMHDMREQAVTNGMLILSYHYNDKIKTDKWYNAEEDRDFNLTFIEKHKKTLKEFLEECCVDTYSQRTFKEFYTRLEENQKRKKIVQVLKS